MGALGDVAAPLLRELRGHLDGSLALTRPPEQLRGGFSADLFAFDVDRPPRQLVLRLLDDDDSAMREARIQAHVEALGYPAPRVVLAGSSDSAFGRPFLVLVRATGRTPLDAAGKLGVPKLFREIPAILATLMADLHALPIGDLVYDGTAAALADVEPGAARDWLLRRELTREPAVVAHGDLHGANLLVDAGGVTAVLDWELATVAPAEYDVARTACILALLPGVPTVARRMLTRPAARTAERFVGAYSMRRPVDGERLRWYEVLHAARLLAIAQRAGAVAGLWRPLVPALERRIAERVRD
jgi:aminoglycoside phosphotransferase (APT) family kinase protein